MSDLNCRPIKCEGGERHCSCETCPACEPDEPTVEQLEAFADPERRPRPVDTSRALDGGPNRWWHYNPEGAR